MNPGQLIGRALHYLHKYATSSCLVLCQNLSVKNTLALISAEAILVRGKSYCRMRAKVGGKKWSWGDCSKIMWVVAYWKQGSITYNLNGGPNICQKLYETIVFRGDSSRMFKNTFFTCFTIASKAPLWPGIYGGKNCQWMYFNLSELVSSTAYINSGSVLAAAWKIVLLSEYQSVYKAAQVRESRKCQNEFI